MKITDLNVVFMVLRNQKGIKQSEVTRITGISQPVISRIEEGGVGVDGERWEKLFSAIGYELKIELKEVK